jgi:hypothetical protein
MTEDYPSMPQILLSGLICSISGSEATSVSGECLSKRLGFEEPTLVIAPYSVMEQPGLEIRYLPGHKLAATNFADSAGVLFPLVREWFGAPRERTKIAELPYPEAAPFESGAFLLAPLEAKRTNSAELAAAHQLTHASFLSFRPWIEEGLAHFAQALYLEQQKGRQAALDYMAVHRTVLNQIESKEAAPESVQEASRALVNTVNDQLYRSKAMCVWWMLRDMIGDAALKKAIAAYKAEDDKEPGYMPRLIAAQTQRDLSWFFDDWINHDRGLPDFKIESAFASKTPTNGFLLTITLDNLGTAGAEVPVNIKLASGEITKRIEMRAKSKVTFRVETPAVPQEVRVNDGSVPESNPGNNVFKVDPPKS